MKIRVASHNHGKLKEFKEILEPYGYEVLDIRDVEDIEETGKTFEENALLKAKTVYEITGDLVIADDSGLMIAALPDLLGVYSARFKPEMTYPEKNAYLLNLLKDVTDRSASFHSVIALVGPGVEKTFAGEVSGVIAHEILGVDGFGYDPIFVPEGFDTSFGVLSAEVKNEISHRAHALKQFIQYFENEESDEK